MSSPRYFIRPDLRGIPYKLKKRLIYIWEGEENYMKPQNILKIYFKLNKSLGWSRPVSMNTLMEPIPCRW